MIDALLCYQRALREVPHGIDAQFHIGQIAWRMGNQAEAMAAWRAASALSPGHYASWHALADALAVVGDFDGSRVAVTHVLSVRPDDPRANALSLLLDAATGEASDALLAGAVRASASWPLLLLARVVEHVLHSDNGVASQALTALVEAASVAFVTRGNEDALRRIAVALADAGESDSAQVFADRYAEACRALYRPPMPLLWPLRTAGDALRVGVLCTEGADALRAALADAGLDDSVRCTMLATDAPAMPTGRADVPPAFGDEAARVVATLALDVLIDFAGVRLASGPLLALHPARALWIVSPPPQPSLRLLADRVFMPVGAPVPAEMITALRELHGFVAKVPCSALTAEELSACREDAVRAHQRGEFDTARAGYARVLDAQPGHAPVLYLTGVAARTAGEDVTARECFRAAVAAAPAYADARVALVASLVDVGDAAEAVAVAREGLGNDATSASLWRALAQAELDRREGMAAAAAFDEA